MVKRARSQSQEAPSFLLLLDNAVAELFLPRPDTLKELLPAQIVAGQSLLHAQLFLHLDLGGDARMVRTGHPQGSIALHPLKAGQDVLHGGVHGVAHVQLTGHIGGRHNDGEGLFLRIAFAPEAAVGLPLGINAALYLFGVIDLGQFFCHLIQLLN